jgi:hypothetical protein
VIERQQQYTGGYPPVIDDGSLLPWLISIGHFRSPSVSSIDSILTSATIAAKSGVARMTPIPPNRMPYTICAVRIRAGGKETVHSCTSGVMR